MVPEVPSLPATFRDLRRRIRLQVFSGPVAEAAGGLVVVAEGVRDGGCRQLEESPADGGGRDSGLVQERRLRIFEGDAEVGALDVDRDDLSGASTSDVQPLVSGQSHPIARNSPLNADRPGGRRRKFGDRDAEVTGVAVGRQGLDRLACDADVTPHPSAAVGGSVSRTHSWSGPRR
ncbi:hypothetical protein ACFTWS_36925 [Streptomyces sp. NPDC057027]|uniref:hypothetical protein n=1 Tax=Streptomyces sp. NPDC057027 TaxID=3346004 RepID=UPI003643A683